MNRVRIIPVLLLQNGGFWKTIQFKNAKYIGDPINTVKLFNEKGADELVILDIGCTKSRQEINFKKITEIAGEAFMPLAYGGGIASLEDAQKVLDAGFEKIVLNTHAFESPQIVTQISNRLGSQSMVVCLDIRTTWWKSRYAYTRAGNHNTWTSPVEAAKRMEELGAGEILVNSVERDGTWRGYDIPLIRSVAEAVKIPVIACGGAGNRNDLQNAVDQGGASAVAAGSMFVYQKKNMGVLVSFPSEPIRRNT